MQDKVIEMAEGQLKRLGMLDALTPDLKNKLRNSSGTVEHSFTKSYGEDNVQVDLTFRKSRTSELSFLNKYDMTLQRPGASEPIKQTFYTPPEHATSRTPDGVEKRHDNKYTLKEAYNLLSGRAVFKHLVSKEGAPYQAWVKMNSKRVLTNGNHEMKQYNQNYGFDLEKTLKEYSIKELSNPTHRSNLIESLQRGNSQKVTFVGKDGKEQQLFIAPSITTSSLNVLDADQKRVPLERLVQEGYISASLVEKLKEQFANKQSSAQEVNPTGQERTKQEVKASVSVEKEQGQRPQRQRRPKKEKLK